MKNLLDFYSNSVKSVVEALDKEQIVAIDRIVMQATNQITQERLISIIERLVAPRVVDAAGSSSASSADLLSVLEAAMGKEQSIDSEDEGKSYHPSPFADLDLGPDEPILSPEDQEADQQLRAEIAAVTQATTDAILKNRKK